MVGKLQVMVSESKVKLWNFITYLQSPPKIKKEAKTVKKYFSLKVRA
jgi:hypothetical protein